MNLCIGFLLRMVMNSFFLAVVCPLTSWTSSLQRGLLPGHHHRHGAHHEHVYGGAVRRHRHGESEPSHSQRGSLPSFNLRRLTQSRCGLHRGGGGLLFAAFVHGELWQLMAVLKSIYFFWLSFSTPGPFCKHQHRQRNEYRSILKRVGYTCTPL